jgi:hypothetical protein
VHPSEHPADANCNYRGRVGLGLDVATQPFFERGSSFTGGAGRIASAVSGLAVKVLRGAGGLIYNPFSSGFCVARDATETFLYFAADISGGSSYSIFVHGHYSWLQIQSPNSAECEKVPIWDDGRLSLAVVQRRSDYGLG